MIKIILRKMRKILVIFFLIVISILTFSFGCQPKIKQALKTAKQGKVASYPMTFIDDLGNKVIISSEPQKIISLAPANTEIIFALKAEEKLIGVTTFCDYPEEAKKIEKIGDFATPNVEKIAALKPDLILAAGGIQEGIVEKLKKLGTQVFVIDPKNFSQLFLDLEELGKILKVEKEAKTLIKKIQSQKKAVEKRTKSLPKVKVFFEIYSQPLMTAGSDTFIDEMINLAGGINVGALAGKGFPQFSEEQLVKEDPDVYIAVKMSMGNPAELTKRPGYANLKAVKKGKVYVVDDNLVTRPGPRLAQGLIEVAKAIHPEAFK